MASPAHISKRLPGETEWFLPPHTVYFARVGGGKTRWRLIFRSPGQHAKWRVRETSGVSPNIDAAETAAMNQIRRWEPGWTEEVSSRHRRKPTDSGFIKRKRRRQLRR